MQKVKNKTSGITLIALIITVIVLLILAGVTIAALTGSDSAPSKANEAKQKQDIGTAKDEVYLTAQNAQTEAYERVYVDGKQVGTDAAVTAGNASTNVGSYVISKLKEKYDANSEVGLATVTVSDEGKITISTTDFTEIGSINVSGGNIHWGASPEVGDFVTYDAGDWTTDSSGNIIIHYTDGTTEAVADSATKPSTDHKFGGFTTSSGKNGNATPYNDSYNYVKDGSSAVTGWRIFDIDGDKITLISAGCPEDYYHAYSPNNGYKSEYILTGDTTNIPSSVSVSGLSVRDWTVDYGDSSRNITASVLTKAKLEDWYKKYVDSGTTNLHYNATNYGSTTGQSIFQKIYKTTTNAINDGKYESLIDNYSYYWLASADSEYPRVLCYVWPDDEHVSLCSKGSSGVRVLVYLPSSISLTAEPTGTKELVDPRNSNNTYTYNVWGIN